MEFAEAQGRERWMPLIRYGFLDESGGVDPFSGSHFLVVAVLTTRTPRPIKLHLKRARKGLRRKARPDEMKASTLHPDVIKRLLAAVAEEDLAIVAVIVDKRVILRPPEDPEDIYREAVTRAVAHCVTRWPRCELFLDKRYTKAALRHQLEVVIREGIADLPQQVVLIQQEDSRNRKELQVADHIAWAFYQKYELADDSFYEVLKDKVIVEEVVRHHLW